MNVIQTNHDHQGINCVISLAFVTTTASWWNNLKHAELLILGTQIGQIDWSSCDNFVSGLAWTEGASGAQGTACQLLRDHRTIGAEAADAVNYPLVLPTGWWRLVCSLAQNFIGSEYEIDGLKTLNYPKHAVTRVKETNFVTVYYTPQLPILLIVWCIHSRNETNHGCVFLVSCRLQLFLPLS